jgi:hypothetical protein
MSCVLRRAKPAGGRQLDGIVRRHKSDVFYCFFTLADVMSMRPCAE